MQKITLPRMRFDIYSAACLMKEGIEQARAGISPALLGMNKHGPQNKVFSVSRENDVGMNIIPQVPWFSSRFGVHTLGAALHHRKAYFPPDVLGKYSFKEKQRLSAHCYWGLSSWKEDIISHRPCVVPERHGTGPQADWLTSRLLSSPRFSELRFLRAGALPTCP